MINRECYFAARECVLIVKHGISNIRFDENTLEQNKLYVEALFVSGFSFLKEAQEIIKKSTPGKGIAENDYYNDFIDLVKDFEKWIFDVGTEFRLQIDNICKEYDRVSIERVTEKDFNLPDELNTDEAKRVFQKAIEAGLMEKSDTGYKWNRGKQLLSFFVVEASKFLCLGKGERISWKPFEACFGVHNLRGNYNDIQKTGVPPKDVEIVYDVFKKKGG